jgi:hypothetical protein
MPQNPTYDDFGFEPVHPPSSDNEFGFEPWQPPDYTHSQQQEQPSNSWWDTINRQGLSTIPAIAGSMAGAPLGPLGVIGGGFLGGALGSVLRQRYDNQPVNPYEVGVEGALNTIPFIGEAPGAGAGLREIGKYALSSATQGGFQGLAGSVPRHIASTGNWELPSFREAAGEGLGGAAFGGAMGLGHGVLSGYGGRLFGENPSVQEPTPPSESPYIHDMSHANYEQSSFDMPGLGPQHDPRQQVIPGFERFYDPNTSALDKPPASPYGFGMGMPTQRMLDFNSGPAFDPSFNAPTGQGTMFEGDPRSPIVRNGGKSTQVDPRVMEQLASPVPESTSVPAPTAEPMNPKSSFEQVMQAIIDIQNKKKMSGYGEGEVPASDVVRIPTKELTPEKKQNLIDGGYEYHGNDKGQEVFVRVNELDHEGISRQSTENEFDPNNDIARAKVQGGGLSIDVDTTRAARNITKDYTSPLPGIMVREGMQNALDAADQQGTNGVVKVRLNDNKKTIEIHDNGNGLDEKGLSEKLVRLFATGKSNEAGATGGKGIGSASYIIGGKHFEIETVAVDSIDGKKYKITAKGTPEQFLDPVKGSEYNKVRVLESTPTGTTMKVALTDAQEMYHASDMARKVNAHTRDRPSKVIFDRWGETSTPLSTLKKDDGIMMVEHLPQSSANDKLIGDFDFKDSNVKIQIPKFDPNVERGMYNIHYLNNGMYQFSDSIHLPHGFDKVKNLPPDVLVNIHPLVDEMHDNYPFINTREDVKKDMRAHITKFVDDNIGKPALDKQKNRTQELYDAMGTVPMGGTRRRPILFDPGDRLTPAERKYVENHPVVHQLIQFYDKLVNDIIESTGHQAWMDRLEGVGLVLDPGSNGIHIPNPTTGKSSIGFNPFHRIADDIPVVAAFKGIITGLHETAHIGTETGGPVDLTPSDLADPRVGKYLQSYLEQVVQHGDVGYKNTGHGMGFMHRLGDIYASFGVKRTFDAAGKLDQIYNGPTKSGSYRREIQELLQVYSNSRGRDPVTEDLLSRTGVKQATRLEGEGSIPSTDKTNGDGNAWERIKASTGWGQGSSKEGTHKKSDVNYVKEILAVPAGLTTTLDASIPGRQGLTQIATPEFWKGMYSMFKSVSPEAYKVMDDELRSRPIFKDRRDPRTQKVRPSIAKEAGLKLFKTPSEGSMSQRAEGVASRWLEQGIGTGPIATAYKNTIGAGIRMTNRMAITFLNQVGANRFEKLMNTAEAMSFNTIKNKGVGPMSGMLGGMNVPGVGHVGFNKNYSLNEAMDLNPYHNVVRAKEIADFVNTALGHGPLKTHILPFKQTEVSLESAADKLSYALFSPGLIASRTRMLNPSTYIMASPFVRKQYMKAAVSTAAAWFMFTEMAKLAGGDQVSISNNITSADFGKVRIGNTRMDPGGGFLQFLTAYGRLYAGGSTSSSTNEFHRFGSGYQAQTQEDMMQRFMVNKLNPVAKFAYDLANASQYNPFHVGDRTMQLFVPLVMQDMKEIVDENPDLLPWMIPVGLGMGTQTYSKGESVGKLIPPEKDWLVTGGGLKDLIP